MSSRKQDIICGLDVGTSKICLLIARLNPQKELEVVSSGYALSAGLKKGIVVNMEEAAASIRKAVDEAEAQAGLSVDTVIVGVTGDHIQSYNCHGAITLEGDRREVTQQDAAQVVQAAQSIPIPPGREIIHVLTQEFFLDNRGDIQNPIGLTGSRLDVNIHVVTSETASNQNLINAVNRAQLRVKRIVLQPLASAASVLTPDEKELGTLVVDIGAATTDIAIFGKNATRFTASLPLGGAHFTRDLAVGLRTPLEDAEDIKRASGTVLTENVASDETVTIPGIGTRHPRDVPRQVIARILRERAIELLELIKDQILRAGERDQLVAGTIFTGGGSMLKGMLELAEQVLQIPVRQGLPIGIRDLREDLSHPIFASAVGLTMWGLHENDQCKWTPKKQNSTSWFIDWLLSFVGH